MKKIFAITFLLLSIQSHAQFGKKLLEKAKQTTENRVNNKVDQKTDKTIDKILDAPEKAVKNKKDKANTTVDISPSTDNKVETEPVIESNGEGNTTIINTNIRCAVGKKKMEDILKMEEGVFEVSINIKNGKLSIRYSSDGTPYSALIERINENGFEADGKKPISTKANPCNK